MVMKKIVLAVLFICNAVGVGAQSTTKSDSVNFDIKETVEQFYKTVVPMLDRIEFSGSGEVSQELRNRWGNVVNYIKNNKEFMADEVKRLLISPTGKSIDLEMVKQFINISEKDSLMKISINPEFLIDELREGDSKRIKIRITLVLRMN